METIAEHGLRFLKNGFGIRGNKQTLVRKTKEVSARESDIKLTILREEEQGKRATDEAKLWLENAEQFKREVDWIINHFSYWKLWNYPWLCLTVVAKIEEADSLLERGSKFSNGPVIDQLHDHDKAILFEPPSLCGQSTAEATMEKIMELLIKKPEIRKIGVYGMGGAGKTTIMKNIYNKLATMTDHLQFDRIIWVTVSKDMGGVEGLQNRIAHELGHDLGDQRWCKAKQAALLLKKLKQTKRFLLVLDDLWEQISLEEIGIPDPDREGNDCKIVVTTRSLKVCKFIQTHRDVEVKCLSEEEAWKLFVSKTGDYVLRDSEITHVAKDVARECGGLPLAIITVGCAMRSSNITVWRNTLNELKSPMVEGTAGMEDKVFNFLKLSYNHLREEVKKCFLYCAFFPEDDQIEEYKLIEYWMAEGYTKMTVGESSKKRKRLAESYYGTWDLKAEMYKGFKIMQELKDACLLEIFYSKEQGAEYDIVKMHDLIRDMAIKIMREEDHGFISKAGLRLTEFPDEEAFEEATKVSLMFNHIEALPDKLNCPSLSTLLLCNNLFPPFFRRRKLCLPESSFSGMLSLQVLDLSSCGRLTQLPASLSDLCNLRALFLKSLEVAKIPSLAKLKKLQVLNLRETKIQEMPEGMEELLNLRYLDLSNMPVLKWNNISLKGLTRLEVLLLGSTLYESQSSSCDTFIQEIVSLKRLTTLDITFKDLNHFLKAVKWIHWQQLKFFFVGAADYGVCSSHPPWGSKQKIVEILNFDLCSLTSRICLPDQTEVFHVKNCNIQSLFALFPCLKGLRYLKSLSIYDCVFKGRGRRLISIVEVGEMEPNTWETLEKLKLWEISEAEVIWSSAMPNGSLSFTNLRTLDVRVCDGLKTLFSYEILGHLKNIEVIFTIFCKGMEQIEGPEIVDGETLVGDMSTRLTTLTIANADQIIVLPKLRILYLDRLPELSYVSKRVWMCNSLEHLAIFECPKLKELPFQSFPASANIYGDSGWWKDMISELDSAEMMALFKSNFKDLDHFSNVPELRKFVSE